MVGFENLRERWRQLGAELIVRATSGVSTGSLLNADAGRAVTSARIEDWASVLSLYTVENSYTAGNSSDDVRASA